MTAPALLDLRGPIRRVLVLRPRALGDVLLTTPALRALQHGFPHAEIHAAVDDTLVPVLRRNPHVHRVWALPRRQRGARAWMRLYRDVARVRFDLVVDLHGSPRTAWIAFWSRARNRVGYRLRGRGRLYNLRVPRDSDRAGRRRMLYAAQTNLEIVARLGVGDDVVADTSLVFVPDPAIDAAMRAMLQRTLPAAPRIGLVPAGTWPAKTAPPELFTAVAERLLAAGCGVLLLWGPGELDVAQRIAAATGGRARLAPETDLDQLAGCLAGLDLLITHDSGVKHLACARGTPTLTLFGPTNPRAWLPPQGPHAGLHADLACIGCNFTRCAHQLCMRRLDADTIAAAGLRMLDRSVV